LYASHQANYAQPHDPEVIPTEPKISQAQAIDTVEMEYRRIVTDYQEAYLHVHYYNFSQELVEDEEYQQYLRSIAPGWKLSDVKTNPELLSLTLVFVHANGTLYMPDDAKDGKFEKVCDQPSPECPLGRFGEFARDRLVYEVGGFVDDGGYDPDIHLIIDAETGKVVSSTPLIVQKPTLPRSILENMYTIQELNQLIENPEDDGVSIEIVQNASEVAQNSRGIDKGYRPAQVFETLFNATVWAVWFNYDSVSHTVTSDTGYVDLLGREFDSGVIEPGKSFEFVFVEPGYYGYHCEIHPWMKGELNIVENFA
jgi:hypothetical protein